MSPARLEARMDSLLSFPVGLFHPLQHAGLSRRSPDCRLTGSDSVLSRFAMPGGTTSARIPQLQRQASEFGATVSERSFVDGYIRHEGKTLHPYISGHTSGFGCGLAGGRACGFRAGHTDCAADGSGRSEIRQVFLPARFASYKARSAFFISVSASSPCTG